MADTTLTKLLKLTSLRPNGHNIPLGMMHWGHNIIPEKDAYLESNHEETLDKSQIERCSTKSGVNSSKKSYYKKQRKTEKWFHIKETKETWQLNAPQSTGL